MANTDGSEKSPTSQDDNSASGKKRRSPQEIAVARDKVKSGLYRCEGETDEQFQRRVNLREKYLWQTRRRDNHSVDNDCPKKRNPIPSGREIAKKVDNLRESHPKLPHESIKQWTDRLTRVERNQYKYYKKNPDYIPKYLKEDTQVVPKIILDTVRSNNPWDDRFEKRKTYMARTYRNARRIYETGDTNYENSLPSSPKGIKRKRS